MAAQQQETNIGNLQERNFLHLVPADSPLVRVENAKILENMIDPTTGHAYEGGIVLEGEFASLEVLNNNNRIYTEENYIGFVEELKKKIWSKDGLFGEYEHPKGYSTDGKNVSHKILDIWYDKATKKVFGVVLVLNTTNGRDAMEVIKSGGSLGISARAGGKEITNPNGTITATIKLMVTFDLVWHPGFTTARLNFVNLNESESQPQRRKAFTIYESNLEELDNMYESFQTLNKDKTIGFFDWVEDHKLFESAGPNLYQHQEQQISSEQQQNLNKLQDGQNNDQQQVEDDLQDAVDQQLSQKQGRFFQEMQNAQLGLGRKMRAQHKLNESVNAAKATGKYKKQGNSVYDNSAGFESNGGVVGMGQNDGGFDINSQVEHGGSDAQGTGFLTEMQDQNPYAMKVQNQDQNHPQVDNELDIDPYGLNDVLMEDFGNTDGYGFNGGETEQEMNAMVYERQFSGAQRKQLAAQGQALPDGSFPIVNEKDLQNAISTYGLSKDKPRAKKWIVKRANALGKADLIPKSWK